LDGKVAIVTGAGQGLGRVEALELARHGARVVVNDLGTAADGTGASEEPARSVVAEIEALGGKAVAAFGDVADFEAAAAIVRAAVSAFGGLHILVNNAGFSRDGMLVKMEDAQFWDVVRVHLKGHFCMMRHTLAHWRERAKAAGASPLYGRLISTASDAFLMGNLGQPNYAAAKAGVTYLTMSAAREAQRYGATANVILPRARTRMTSRSWAGIFAQPEQGFRHLRARSTAAGGVAGVASAAHVSGQVIQAGR
jgi:3-oxoacyl-[acyl-carrier protein] reductase